MKKLCYLLVTGFFSYILFSQTIPSHAYVGGGVGKVLLNPPTSNWQAGQTVTVDVLFNSTNVVISGLQTKITFPVVANDLEVISVTPNTALSGWTFPIATHQTSGGVTNIEIMGLNISPTGFATNTNTLFAQLTLKPKYGFTAKPFQFDQPLSKMLRKSDATDILGTTANGSYNNTGPTPISTVTLKVKLEGITQQRSNLIMQVVAKSPPATTQQFTPEFAADSAGIYTTTTLIDQLLPGSYDFFIKSPIHLRHSFPGKTLLDGANTVDLTGFPLLAGDAYGDNKVNGLDYGLFTKEFSPTGPSTGSRADFDFDADVDGNDFRYIGNNYAQVGDEL